MHVLVLGATGLLGSHIVDLCVQNRDAVRVLVRKGSDCEYLKRYPHIEYSYGSLEDPISILKAADGIDVVYHSAARVTDWGSRRQFMETNYKGTVNVVQSCRANGVKRLVYVSSPSVVFNYKDEVNINENQPYPKKFANHYSESKALAEQFVIRNHDPGRIETVVVRPHAIWGPRDKTGFLARILAKIRAGKMIDLSGGKEVMVDMCYVLNAAHACVLAAISKNAGGKIYFIADDAPTNAWQFFNQVAGRLGLDKIQRSVPPGLLTPIIAIIELVWNVPYLMENYPPPINRYSLGVLTNSTTYNLSAAKKDLNYRPLVDIETGIDNFVKWVDEIGGLDAYLNV
ncbi:MAG: NAD-dependent epimerase/dehydratase family protein [Spirochaetes bacterium]|nr:NAD-dependent epimerase/dehydratase family protein [Spirochaetota bacterium]